jgi:hypothetical protein
LLFRPHVPPQLLLGGSQPVRLRLQRAVLRFEPLVLRLKEKRKAQRRRQQLKQPITLSFTLISVNVSTAL